jgi:hypothetical protein
LEFTVVFRRFAGWHGGSNVRRARLTCRYKNLFVTWLPTLVVPVLLVLPSTAGGPFFHINIKWYLTLRGI